MDQSQFLWALPALLLPFLIRFIVPPRPVKIYFSQMNLLNRVLKKIPPMRKSSQWPLTLIRIFCVAAFILCLLGLFIFSRGTPNERISQIMIIDDTWSNQLVDVNGQVHWQRTLEIARESLGEIAFGSEVALLGFSGKSIGWSGSEEILERLKKIGAGVSEEDWVQVQGEMKRLFRTRPGDKVRVTLISDGKCSDRDGLMRVLSLIPKGTMWNHISWESQLKENLSVRAESIQTRDSMVIHGKILAPNHMASVKLKYTSVQGEVREKDVLTTGLITAFSWKIASANPSAGFLELEVSDGFAPDNISYFTDKRSQTLNLVLFDVRKYQDRLKNAEYYLKKGLQSLEEKLPVHLQVREPRSWASFDNGFVDIVIVHNPHFLSERESTKLLDFTRRGGQVVLMPGPDTPERLLSDRFKEALPAKLKEIQKTNQTVAIPDLWKEKLSRFGEVPFRGRWLFFRLGRESKTELRFSDGAPFWISSSLGKGRMHLISSPFSMSWSDSVVLGDFPAFLVEVLAKLSPDFMLSKKGLYLEAGKSIPEHMESIRPLTNGKKLFDSQRLVPGLYECTLKSGRVMTAVCPSPFFSPEARLEIEPLDAELEDRAELVAMHKRRFDPLFALLILLGLLAEVTYLIVRASHRKTNFFKFYKKPSV